MVGSNGLERVQGAQVTMRRIHSLGSHAADTVTASQGRFHGLSLP